MHGCSIFFWDNSTHSSFSLNVCSASIASSCAHCTPNEIILTHTTRPNLAIQPPSKQSQPPFHPLYQSPTVRSEVSTRAAATPWAPVWWCGWTTAPRSSWRSAASRRRDAPMWGWGDGGGMGCTPLSLDGFCGENPIVRNGWWLGVALWLRKAPYVMMGLWWVCHGYGHSCRWVMGFS